MKIPSKWTLVMALSVAQMLSAAPVLRVVKGESGAESLLRNGGFEQLQGKSFSAWQPWKNGYEAVPEQGRNRSRAVLCTNSAPKGEFGASQSIILNRTNAGPLVIRGWSKAENVSGSSDSGYSIYVDITYRDGTTLWGQTGDFRCGTHDWEQREFVILPDKPVKSLTMYCLFRGHSGKVWFDDVSVEEITVRQDAALFQGAPVQKVERKGAPAMSRNTARTDDALAVEIAGTDILSLQVNGRSISAGSDAGFMARDVATNSDFFDFPSNVCTELALEVRAQFLARSNHIAVHGRVSDTTGKDRAVTLVCALPLDAIGWRWGDDIHRSRVITDRGEFVNQTAVRCGATGTESLYPMAAVWNDSTGIALGLDMANPAVFRVGYDAGLKLLYIAYDFGFVRETEQFPNSADFRFVIFRFDPRGGFRAAWQKYREIFPDSFVVRSKEQGLWMPFTDVSKVPGWEDFGFRYHEGNNNVTWDDAHNVLSFRYTEPMTWWMRMSKEVPRTTSDALRVRDELLAGRGQQARQMAEVSRSAAMHSESGEPNLQFRDTPWCDGAVWSLNPNPWLGGTGTLNAANIHWSESIKEKLYGPAARGRLDGEYLDSLEGYVTTDLNFNREHFKKTTVPLTFSADTKRPALFKGLAVFEFTKWMADDVHRMGKLMFANGVPYRFTYLCPWLDVLGTETDWLRGTKYQPASISTLDLWRTLSGGKPYLLLMNSDYDQFSTDVVQKYFERSLFYGMWPGFFSHNAADNPYWQNPKWYERDRPLFKKYLPLVKQVAEGGWQPLTQAACDNENILLERFGADSVGAIYFTILNDTGARQSGEVQIDGAALHLPATAQARNVLGDLTRIAPLRFRITLEPQRAAMIEVRQ